MGGLLGGVWVREATGIEIGDLHLDLKSLMGLQFALLSHFRKGNDLRDHVCSAWNLSHDDAVAGTTLDLQAIREGFA